MRQCKRAAHRRLWVSGLLVSSCVTFFLLGYEYVFPVREVRAKRVSPNLESVRHFRATARTRPGEGKAPGFSLEQFVTDHSR